MISIQTAMAGSGDCRYDGQTFTCVSNACARCIVRRRGAQQETPIVTTVTYGMQYGTVQFESQKMRTPKASNSTLRCVRCVSEDARYRIDAIVKRNGHRGNYHFICSHVSSNVGSRKKLLPYERRAWMVFPQVQNSLIYCIPTVGKMFFPIRVSPYLVSIGVKCQRYKPGTFYGSGS